MSDLLSVVNGIVSALEATKTSIDNILLDSELPTLVSELVAKSGLEIEGVSLLSLKNHLLLSYLNSLVLVVLAHLERMSGDVEDLKLKAVQSSVVLRVTLEKGIKPLEKKLSYQLDKMVRTYNRMLEDEEKAKTAAESRAEANSDESEEESDSESDSDDDALAHRPDAAALAKMAKPASTNQAYKPPKISAVAPPTETEKPKSSKKLQSMEEFLQENSDMPSTEVSIGSSIVDHGRGGVKTSKDRQREAEIQAYEESNFTRLPSTMTKKSFKQKEAEKRNNFAGEDWLMFNNKRSLEESTSRKRKPTTAWDKVKRRK